MGHWNESGGADPKLALMLDHLERLPAPHQMAAQRLRLRLFFAIWRSWQGLDSRLKRALDLAGAGVALLLTLPIMAVTVALIKLDSPGPILFRQTRVGLHGRTFTCFKFRSMYIDAEARRAALVAQNEADGPVFKIRNDPRITRVGRVIRKFSIDELPQIFNVLRGEMSLVGPRPALPSEVAQYTPEQARRLDAVPGITGLQQVSGRSNLDFERWVALDVQYIAEQSVWQDIKILLRTIPTVVTGRGAY
jgi:exopolysaccharide biosynthesis polyprenyl glycosylphosphotransferase